MTPSNSASPILTVVTPCYNEREVIGSFLDAMIAVANSLAGQCDLRVLVVDDGSKDGSTTVLEQWSARDFRVQWLGLARNFGHQAALTAGIDHAAPGAVLTMDSDLEHPPSVIPNMVKHWLAGAEVVSAVRQEPMGLPWWKSVTSNVFYHVFNLLSDVKLQPGAADFVLLSAPARVTLQQMPEYHRFLRAMVSWTGYSRVFVPYEQPVRPAGKSKYTMRRMLRLAFHGVVSFSTRPIYGMFFASLGLAFAGLIYLAYSIWVRLATGDAVAGWTSVIAVLLVLGGWQTLTCSILGVYIGKILEQVKGRPNYVVRRRSEGGAP